MTQFQSFAFLIGVFIFFYALCAQSLDYDKPLIPPSLEGPVNINGPKKIPKNLWIAVVNSTEVSSWSHILNEKKLNPDWKVNIWDNEAKDNFMKEYFADTSLLWAYNNINPIVGGAAKADIWRYAALYVHGGVYIDSDSALTKPLDGVVKADDEMIVTFELNHYEGDWCYSPNSKLSTILTTKQHPSSATLNLFHGRNILNWCIMSMPRHYFLRKAMENFVHLVKLEYIGLAALKIQKWDTFSKYVYCTTGPSLFTASLREASIELHEMSLGQNQSHFPQMGPTKHRLASRDFIQEGGLFKVVNKVAGDKRHYTQVSNHEYRFLINYAPEKEAIEAIQKFVTDKDMEGSLIMGRHKKSVYVLNNGLRRPIGGMDIFLAFNYSLKNVIHLSDFVISQIPLGESMTMPS